MGLLENLADQQRVPDEVIIIDGAPPGDTATEEAVAQVVARGLPFAVRHQRAERGTAVQRNAGLDLATGALVALIDDDIRLDPGFLDAIIQVFAADEAGLVGGVVGYRTNQYLGRNGALPPRWRWYRRLGLLTTFEPGAYDWATGYPINANLQPPFTGTRPVSFMTTACAVWRRAVFEGGLRFDPWFQDYGVLEDAHLALRAGRTWTLLQCGDARCEERSAPGGRVSNRAVGYKTVVNYWYVFTSVAGPLSASQVWRFWRFQAFEVVRILAYLVAHPSRAGVDELLGRAKGFAAVAGGVVRRATVTAPARTSD